MTDTKIEQSRRRYLQSGTWQDLEQLMRNIDRYDGTYLEPTDSPGGEHNAWHSSPISSLKFGPTNLVEDHPEAWLYAKNQGGLLQSLAEAVTNRAIFYKQYELTGEGFEDTFEQDYRSLDTQMTRTVYLQFYGQGGQFSERKLYTAFAELPDTNESLELIEIMHQSQGTRIWDRDTPIIQTLLGLVIGSQRAVKEGNTLAFQYLRTGQVDGRSEYGTNHMIRAAFGSAAIAELHASLIHKQETPFCYVRGLQIPNNYPSIIKLMEGGVSVNPVELLGLGDSCHRYENIENSQFRLYNGVIGLGYSSTASLPHAIPVAPKQD